MNDKLIAVVDVSGLCHRAWHSTGKLAYGDRPTGVAFGVLNTIEHLQSVLVPDVFAFAYDKPPYRRADLYPPYKQNRKLPSTEEEKADKAKFYKQVDELPELLKRAGFMNHLSQPGYEADDVLATVALTHSDRNRIILVTSDEDMYQCLDENVSIYNPKKKERVTAKSFEFEYGIVPGMWPVVKAIAGCSGDNIKGVAGVGEKTAIKYLKGMLKKTSKKHRDITAVLDDQSSDGLVQSNMTLVRLPLMGMRGFDIQEDSHTLHKWVAVQQELGIRPQRKRRRDKPKPAGFF